MRGILRKIFLAVAAIILFYVMGGWKIPVLWRISNKNMDIRRILVSYKRRKSDKM